MVTASLLIALIQAIGHKMYPVPDPSNKIAFKNAIKNLPLGAFFMVEAAYIVGSFTGGYVTAWVAATHEEQLSIGLGGMLTVFGFINLFTIPHPLWFAVLTTCTYVPACWTGGVLALR